MIYLYIALGGAIGSCARFWFNNFVAGLLGAEFPWGTLFINIIGSFVISFFGTLTSKIARFAVPPEISVFVMVGICGGFTTFSSFSLQTVQLARAGEWERSFLYVAASVVFCLLSCWVGLVAALAVPGAKAQPMAAAPSVSAEAANTTADGAILALLPTPEATPAILDSAAALAKIFNRPLAALHVRIDPETTILPSEEVLPEAQAQAITARQTALRDAVAGKLAAWRGARHSELTLLEAFGGEAAAMGATGKHAAAIVTPALPAQPLADDALHAAIFDTDAPVLALPPNARFHASGHIAIAWKDAAHARAAISAARPLISNASRITVIAIGDAATLHPEQAIALLGPDGARARLRNPPRGEAPVGEQILAEARIVGADSLVMGAYRHGRVADWILGGVTGKILESSDIPLFLKQ